MSVTAGCKNTCSLFTTPPVLLQDKFFFLVFTSFNCTAGLYCSEHLHHQNTEVFENSLDPNRKTEATNSVLLSNTGFYKETGVSAKYSAGKFDEDKTE